MIFWCGIVVPTSADNIGGYTVSPVEPGMNTGTPFETTEVNFWELPVQVILLSLALCISPLLELGIQLVLFTRLLMYLGYRQIAGKNLLNNDTRDKIYQCIQDNPGIYFNSIQRKTRTKHGTLRYHLRILHAMKKISILISDGHARYYQNSGVFSEPEKIVLKYIQNETDNTILRLLLDDSTVNRKTLGEKLGISGVMVTWYMKRLTGAGIIIPQKAGKNVRYDINPDMRHYLEKYLVPAVDTRPAMSYEHISEAAE
jgi:predicted transcriptional regulator